MIIKMTFLKDPRWPVFKSQKKEALTRLIFVLIITLIAYFPILFNGFFCWDDKEIALSPVIRNLDAKTILKFFTSFQAGLYHPLTTLSFAIDYWAGKGSPFIYHFTSLILHVLNTMLVFLLIRRMTGNFFIATFSALLFGVTPMSVETAGWVTARKDLLYGFFFLASMLAYHEFSGKEKNKVLFYILAFVLMLFSCLSKVQAAVLPFIFLLMDFQGNRKIFSTRNLVEKIPFFLLAIFIVIINYVAQHQSGLTEPQLSYSFWERSLLVCYGFSQYFLRILIPVQVSVFFPYPFTPGSPFSLHYLFPVFFVLLFVLFGIWLAQRRTKEYFFGFGFFFITIIMALGAGYFREFIIAGRYAYIASAGLFIFLAVFLDDIRIKYPQLQMWIRVACASYILVLGIFSFMQARLWHSPHDVIESASEHFPGTPILLNTLASIEIDSAQYDEAVYHAGIAAGLDATYAQAWYTRALAEDKLGWQRKAVSDYTRAILINPGYFDAWFGRGNVFLKAELYQQALFDYTRVISLRSDHAGAWINRAIVKGDLGDFRGALEDLDQAIQINTRSGLIYYLRAIAKFECGLNGCMDLEQAISLGYSDAQRALDHYCK